MYQIGSFLPTQKLACQGGLAQLLLDGVKDELRGEDRKVRPLVDQELDSMDRHLPAVRDVHHDLYLSHQFPLSLLCDLYAFTQANETRSRLSDITADSSPEHGGSAQKANLAGPSGLTQLQDSGDPAPVSSAGRTPASPVGPSPRLAGTRTSPGSLPSLISQEESSSSVLHIRSAAIPLPRPSAYRESYLTARKESSTIQTERLYRIGIALETFRRDFGVEANPEDFPELWEQYLTAADEISEEEER